MFGWLILKEKAFDFEKYGKMDRKTIMVEIILISDLVTENLRDSI